MTSFPKRAAVSVLIFVLVAASAASAGVAIRHDGADGAPAVIRIQSAITRGELAAFESALDRVERLATGKINGVPLITVELDSPGGDLVEAVQIGRVIHRHFLMTLVRPGQECVSACVFILMAGAVHTPADSASIGLHRPLLVSWSGMSGQEARARYDGLMAYLRDYFITLGVSEAAYDVMMRTDSYGMRYFSPAELDRFRLRGEDPAWENLYSATWSAAAQPATAARRPVPAEAPKLREIDTSYRDIVYMPGAWHKGGDYLAGIHLPDLSVAWQSLDEAGPGLDWAAPDMIGWAKKLIAAIETLLAPIWAFLALLTLEIARARHWPSDPSPKTEREGGWRLGDFAKSGSE